MKHWTFRQLALSFLLLGAIGIAIYDPTTRDKYYVLVNAVVAGYFAQMNPQGKK